MPERRQYFKQWMITVLSNESWTDYPEPADLAPIKLLPAMPNVFYLSLGSNIKPEKNLVRAVDQLGQFGRVTAVSTVWDTAPLGKKDQPNFLNAVVALETSLSATEFQEIAIPHIESGLNRVRTEEKFGPRTIDIDILLYNREVLAIGHRAIPSPEIMERAFVAIPLAEIAPAYRHPVTGQPLEMIAKTFQGARKDMRPRQDVNLGDRVGLSTGNLG